MPTFTSGADTYTVSAAGTYDLDMLGGDDRLNVYGGTSVTAHLGDGNDLAVLKAAILNIFGDAGADKFDIWAVNAAVDGGADNDTINVRGGSGLTAHGGLGADRINFYADTSGVTLYGEDGNDDFVGYNHNVSGTLYGGAGSDYFVQFRSGAILLGGLGNDIYRITVGSPAAVIENASEGIDAVQVARGYTYTLPDNVENMSIQGFTGSVLTNATLTGNGLNNHIAAHNNAEAINGLEGNDSLGGKGGDDTLDGGNGNDYLDGGSGNDAILGGAGDDSLQGRTGDDAMSGGAGNDTYYVDSLSDLVTEDVGAGSDIVRVSVNNYLLPDNVETGIIQGAVGLSLRGNSQDNHLIGGSGNDFLYGNGGNDVLKGGLGDDFLDAGAGSIVAGGAGDDTYWLHYDSQASIVELAGSGSDTVSINVDDGDIDYTMPANVENAHLVAAGMGRSVYLTGNELNNALEAYGYAGVTIHGGAGDDTLTILGSSGEAFNTAYGEEGNDQLVGSLASDALYGGTGNDQLAGNQSSDSLSGGAGNDALNGGEGSDLLDGEAGADTLTGGAGSDTFAFRATSDSVAGALDSITDFASAFVKGSDSDTLDLSQIDANTLVGGDQAFTLIGSNAFSHTAGELRAVSGKDGTSYHLYGDTNGDGVADFELSIHVTGLALYANDIVL